VIVLPQRVQILVLGHLEASVDDQPVALGGAKQRAVLAMLGLEANRTVSADRLIEGLWGEEPPASAAKMVQNYVWRLRGALGDDGAEILTHGRGYELRIDADLVDACRLERLVAEAARAAEAGEPDNAARAALALFRGAPLADVADEPFAGPEIRRLEELRLIAAELAIDADLAAGRHQEVVAEIDALLADNPLRERLHAQRMLALYRCGRQGEALEAFRHARAMLVEEIGVEPAPELRRLHEAILRQDLSLDVEPAPVALQPELDPTALPPLLGRDAELRRLRACLQGGGALVAVVGAYGMGKTRLAAEIAGEAHGEGTAVFYAAGSGPPEAGLAAIARARESRRPALLVVDDADRAPVAVRAALRDLETTSGDAPVLALATGQEAAALARLEPRESIVLEPLDAAAVRAIAGFYAPVGGTVPLQELLDASRGVPRRIHEAASEWARREATRRVDSAADRAAAGRTEARTLEAELAGSVEELQSTRERAGMVAGTADIVTPVVCPYKGLATFEVDDAEYFFGRERLAAELVARLVGAPLLAIVGPSGSGKSSVLRAGLLPALAGGVLPGSDNWTQAVIRPGAHPTRELARATRRLAREWHRVLAVDQFEELFTACRDETARAEFVAALVRFARDGGVVVLAVRADFYGRCAAYPELARLLAANHVLVGPMSRDELRRAIERPAERVGLSVEPDLAEALLSDVEGQPGALPLLSTTLLELWRDRDQRRLRLASYARSGGVHGAVARLAESAYVELDRAHQVAARRLLLRLTDEGENRAVVRRRLALTDLDAELSAVVAELSERRLLTVSDGTVEVAHEALLREWPRLRGWLEEDVQGRRLHRRLSDAARAWDADRRDPAGLYRGGRLASALDWAAEHGPELNTTEQAFLDDSRRASGRAQRRLRAVLAGVATLLVLAVIAGIVALDQRSNARAEATTAAAQRLGAQALVDDDLGRSLLLARQGMALENTRQTRSNLLAALLRTPAAIGVLRGDGDQLEALALSPDDRTLAMIDIDGTLSLFDTQTSRLEARETMQGFVDATPDVLGFSDDGTRLAVGGREPAVLDVRTRKLVMRNEDAVRGFYAVRFVPDGRTLLAGIAGPGTEISVQRLAVATGRPIGLPRLITHGNGFDSSSFVVPMLSHDGRSVITTLPGRTEIRDATTLRVRRRWPTGAAVAALSPNDRTLLLGGTDGSLRFLDLRTGTVRTASGRHAGAVVRAVFAPGGRTAVTAGEDNQVIVWDVRRGAVAETLQGHAGQTTSLAVSSDGRTLYTGGLDGKVLIWDLEGTHRFNRPFRIGPVGLAPFADYPFMSTAVSPDGRILAAGLKNGAVSLFDVRTLRRIATFPAVPRGPVRGMGYIPHTGRLVVGGSGGFLGIFDPDTGRVVQNLHGSRSSPANCCDEQGPIPQLPPSFSADGRLMATADANDVLLWRLRAGRAVGAPRHYGSVGAGDVSLSPDGRTMVVAAVTGVEVVNVATLRRRLYLVGAADLPSRAEFTPDGRYVLEASPSGWTRMWSTKTWQPVGRLLAGHTGDVIAASVSPDGRTIATGSVDGTIRLYDAATQALVGAPLPAQPNRPVTPLFTPDGDYLLAIMPSGQAYRWDVRPSAWAQRACAIAGRTLTRPEWNDALPGRAYAPACTG
jgi:WD40 repeat protein/DNA-binding SARP family transcriptional activator